MVQRSVFALVTTAVLLSVGSARAEEAYVRQSASAATAEMSATSSLRTLLATPVDLSAARAAASAAPTSNIAQVVQVGAYNSGTVTQSGGGNVAALFQQGQGNVAVISQTGRGR